MDRSNQAANPRGFQLSRAEVKRLHRVAGNDPVDSFGGAVRQGNRRFRAKTVHVQPVEVDLRKFRGGARRARINGSDFEGQSKRLGADFTRERSQFEGLPAAHVLQGQHRYEGAVVAQFQRFHSRAGLPKF